MSVESSNEFLNPHDRAMTKLRGLFDGLRAHLGDKQPSSIMAILDDMSATIDGFNASYEPNDRVTEGDDALILIGSEDTTPQSDKALFEKAVAISNMDEQYNPTDESFAKRISQGIDLLCGGYNQYGVKPNQFRVYRTELFIPGKIIDLGAACIVLASDVGLPVYTAEDLDMLRSMHFGQPYDTGYYATEPNIGKLYSGVPFGTLGNSQTILCGEHKYGQELYAMGYSVPPYSNAAIFTSEHLGQITKLSPVEFDGEELYDFRPTMVVTSPLAKNLT